MTIPERNGSSSEGSERSARSPRYTPTWTSGCAGLRVWRDSRLRSQSQCVPSARSLQRHALDRYYAAHSDSRRSVLSGVPAAVLTGSFHDVFLVTTTFLAHPNVEYQAERLGSLGGWRGLPDHRGARRAVRGTRCTADRERARGARYHDGGAGPNPSTSAEPTRSRRTGWAAGPMGAQLAARGAAPGPGLRPYAHAQAV